MRLKSMLGSRRSSRLARFALPIVVAWFSLVLSTDGRALSLAQDVRRPLGWDESTHGNRVEPDYRRLFSTDRVHELHIGIAADDFMRMQTDLRTIRPSLGRGQQGAPPSPGSGRPLFPPAAGGASQFSGLIEASRSVCDAKAAGAFCAVEGMNGRCNAGPDGPDSPLMCVPTAFVGAMRGGPPNLATREPIYVPVSVRHQSRVWTNVGMRYKGNSSLMAANASGTGKIPFRLDFDRYEDKVPATANQRFYGFSKLTFSSNFSDDSQLREVLASEVFRNRGVPAPRAAFYRIFVDTGGGPEYWGLYSMVEDPADGAMLDDQFGGRKGNLYKPEGLGADWTRFTVEGFAKKTNEEQADFRDVIEAIRALNAPADDRRSWRTALEKAFDVDLFLRWLAVNTAIDNWDVYGAMAHNYYLYADPAQKGRLRWIPWDNNMAFGIGFGFRGGGPGLFPGARPGGPPPLRSTARVETQRREAQPPPFGSFARDVLHRNITDRWPLIQRLLADDIYAARYRELLRHALEGLLAPAAFEKRARALHALIAPFVAGPQGERSSHTTITSPAAFEQSIDGPGGLLEQVDRRREMVRLGLDGGITQ